MDFCAGENSPYQRMETGRSLQAKPHYGNLETWVVVDKGNLAFLHRNTSWSSLSEQEEEEERLFLQSGRNPCQRFQRI
ncbi:hypothetical protein SLA2020_350450 [Shorea laevis]